MKPRFDHDCSACIFLGQYQEYDLYFCPAEPTIIARYSSEGGDYGSGIVFALSDKPQKKYSVALIRALRTGYKEMIAEYVRKYHSDFPNRVVNFSELRLIAETEPENYLTILPHLNDASLIEDHLKGVTL